MKVLLSSTRIPGSLYYRATDPARAVNEGGFGVEVELTYGLSTTMDGPGDDDLALAEATEPGQPCRVAD